MCHVEESKCVLLSSVESKCVVLSSVDSKNVLFCL